MTGLERIIAEILRESAEKADEIAEEAEISAKQIKEKSEDNVRIMLEKAEKEAASAYNAILERGNAAANSERKRIILEQKLSVISDVTEEAVNELKSYDTKRYFDYMKKLLDSCGAASGKIIFNAADKARITPKFRRVLNERGITVSDKTSETAAGFILSCGDTERNCSVEALLRERRNEICDRLMNIVFREE